METSSSSSSSLLVQYQDLAEKATMKVKTLRPSGIIKRGWL